MQNGSFEMDFRNKNILQNILKSQHIVVPYIKTKNVEYYHWSRVEVRQGMFWLTHRLVTEQWMMCSQLIVGRGFPNPPILWRPLYIGYTSFLKFWPTPPSPIQTHTPTHTPNIFFALFPWLIVWSPHICVKLLNNISFIIMDLGECLTLSNTLRGGWGSWFRWKPLQKNGEGMG